MLQDFLDKYCYVYDKPNRDLWHILKPDEHGVYKGDCEDFALTVLWLLCDKSRIKFWDELIFGDSKLCYVQSKSGGHAVLKVGDQYIDNWTKEFVSKEEMEKLGHKFIKPHFRWWIVLLKLRNL